MSLDEFLKQLLGEYEESVSVGSEPAFQFVLPIPEKDDDA